MLPFAEKVNIKIILTINADQEYILCIHIKIFFQAFAYYKFLHKPNIPINM